MEFLVNFHFDSLFSTNIQYMLIYNLECLDTSLDIRKKKRKFLPLFSVASFSRSSNFVGNLLSVIANSYKFKFCNQIQSFWNTKKHSFEHLIRSAIPLTHFYDMCNLFSRSYLLPHILLLTVKQWVKEFQIRLKEKLSSSDCRLWEPGVYNEQIKW